MIDGKFTAKERAYLSSLAGGQKRECVAYPLFRLFPGGSDVPL